MFTGIIESTARLLQVSPLAGKKLLKVERPQHFDDIKIGSSIACNGICLTVLEFDSLSFKVEIMHETVEKSTAGIWQVGTILNLERALKLGDRLDGHWLQGHVDRSVRVLSRPRIEGTDYIRLQLFNEDRKLLVHQGSVAINGVSLTVAELRSSYFSIAIIGHTQANSNLASLKPGDNVNVEYDVLGKYLLNQKGLLRD
jgi:riboflavin synthase